MTRELDDVELGQRVAESPGWVNVCEDRYGHAINHPDGNLVYDPRCYYCREGLGAFNPAQVAGGGGSR